MTCATGRIGGATALGCCTVVVSASSPVSSMSAAPSNTRRRCQVSLLFCWFALFFLSYAFGLSVSLIGDIN